MKKLSSALISVALMAQMAHAWPECGLGEIKIFAGNFAPRNWMFCDGQLLPIAQNSALFSLLGTTYGGDGRTTFGLPDLRGRAPIHEGTGPGLTPKSLGSKGGSETTTLTASQLPAHTHPLKGTSSTATTESGAGAMLATTPQNVTGVRTYNPSNASLITLHSDSIAPNSGGQSHNNMPPYLTVNYIICTVGVFPSRN
jgi:microcystin-dependent protein